jgi:hypothetical protein
MRAVLAQLKAGHADFAVVLLEDALIGAEETPEKVCAALVAPEDYSAPAELRAYSRGVLDALQAMSAPRKLDDAKASVPAARVAAPRVTASQGALI